MNLRDYQRDAVDGLLASTNNTGARVILCLPTGSGKTLVATTVIQRFASQGKQSLFVVDRRSLITQTKEKFEKADLTVGILAGASTSIPKDPEVVVASIQSIRARQTYGIEPDLVLIDEVHILHKSHIDLLLDLKETPCIGMSATPLNPALSDHFDELLIGPTTVELVEQGHLVPCDIYAPSSYVMQRKLASLNVVAGDYQKKGLGALMDSKGLVGDVVRTWKKLGKDKPTLCFCVNVQHSKNIVNAFKTAGVPAAHIDHKTSDEQRLQVFQRFALGKIKVVSSCLTIGIGVDLPEAEVAILARPTLSKMLHIQQVGRILRPAFNKTVAILLDHASNTLLHGAPTDFVVTEIPEKEKVSKKKEHVYRACYLCDTVLQKNATECYRCGAHQPKKNQRMMEVHSEEGELVSLRPETESEEKARWLSELTTVGVNREYSPKWASVQYTQKFNQRPNGERPTYLGTEWKLSIDVDAHVKEGRKRWRSSSNFKHTKDKAWQRRQRNQNKRAP